MTAAEPFVWSDEQLDLRTTLRRILKKESSPAKVFEHIAAGYDRKVWSVLTEQLGLTAILVPECYGGMGGTQIDLAVVLEETGAALLCAPYFSTVVLGTNALLLSADDSACADYLPQIAAGRLVTTLATNPEQAAADPLAGSATAALTSGSWRVSGSGLVALDAMAADLTLVIAEHDGQTSLFAIEANAQGLNRRPLETLDLTRPQGAIELHDTPARLIGDYGTGRELMVRLIDLAATALAAEAVGGASRCLTNAVTYTKQRIQFGRAIASFQAVKQTCADLLMELELGRSAAAYAAWAACEDPAQLPRAAAMARTWCSRMFVNAAQECLQLHGGLGVTWEHRSHLYLRRAMNSAVQLSGPAYHRAVLEADLCGE